MTIFGGYDIRGVYGQDLTEEIATKVGKSLGTFLKGKRTVCVGYDVRLSSKSLFKAFSSGLKSTGCKVIALGLVPNPVLYFYVWRKKIFGCFITASHNPKEWNGFKIVETNGTSALENIKNIENIFNSEKFLEGNGVLTEDKKAIADYEKFLQKKFGKMNGKIVVDFFGGAGTQVSHVFKNCGLKITSLHDKPDGNFYGFSRPEPKGDNLAVLIAEVKKRKAGFGVAFDGDADRSVFIDDKGRELNGSIMASIFSENILEKKVGKVIITQDCASEIKKIVESHGGELVWARVGHGFIEKKFFEEKALFAGEQSSHFWFAGFYPFSDGILSALNLAKILSEGNKKLSQFVDELKLHPIEKMYLNVKNDENKNKIIEELRKGLPDAKYMMDGIRIELNDIEWVLIRASRTLPEINICAEGKNKKRLKEIVNKYTKVVNQKLREVA